MFPVSPSSIEKYDMCKRRWAFHYIEGDKEPGGSAAERGSEMHGIGEKYLIEGAYPDRLTQAGNMFIAGMPYLPAPKSGGVEGELDIVIDGVRYFGRIDYFGSLPAKAKFMGLEQDVDDVTLDHKTSSNPQKYGLWTREAMLAHPQPVIYGTYKILKTDSNETRMRWLYYKSKGPAWAKPSDAVLTRHELEDVFESVVHNKAKEIVRLKVLKPDPNDLDPNTDSCNKYNKPCPYKAKCKLTLAQQLRQPKSVRDRKPKADSEPKEQKMGLLNKIKSEQAVGGATNGTPSAPETPKADKINAPEAAQAPAERVSARPAAAIESPKVALAAKVFAGREQKISAVLRAIADLLDA